MSRTLHVIAMLESGLEGAKITPSVFHPDKAAFRPVDSLDPYRQ